MNQPINFRIRNTIPIEGTKAKLRVIGMRIGGVIVIRLTGQGTPAGHDIGKLTPRAGEKGWSRYHHYLWLPGEYGDFTVDFEFQYTKGGNSGLYFRCADDIDPTKSGFEVQILDSYGVTKELGHHDMGGIIQTQGASKNASKAPGEWNRMTVSMKGDRVVVVLNGVCVQDCNLREKKPAAKNLAATGKIAIQDHGQVFSVRNIRVKKG